MNFGVSSCATAAIINGFLGNLVKARHLGEIRKHILCDSKKVFCAKECAMKYMIEESCTIKNSDNKGILLI